MIGLISEVVRYMLTLLFGVFVSAAIANIRHTKKNLSILFIFCLCNLFIQSVLYHIESLSLVTSFYPVITHLPLLLLFVLAFHKRVLPSVLAITTAYLCCQICNWLSTIPEYMHAPAWAVNLTYIIALIILFPFMIHFAVPSVAKLYTQKNRELLLFGIVPVFYYVFDYIATVYTGLLYNGNIIIAEFVPFLLCIYYLSFCSIYYRQYEEKKEIATRNLMMELRQGQSEREVKTLQQSEKEVTLLRHDMLHFLNNISLFIENEEYAEAQNYIQNLIQTTRSTAGKRYCKNQMVNMILASYGEIFSENEINFSYTVNIPKDISISDVDITSILSNALENALIAVQPLESTLRIIELHMTQKGEKLLIQLSNSYARKPQMTDGCPVAEQQGHGFGTQSILYTVEKLHGNCLFSVNDERFVLQIVV